LGHGSPIPWVTVGGEKKNPAQIFSKQFFLEGVRININKLMSDPGKTLVLPNKMKRYISFILAEDGISLSSIR